MRKCWKAALAGLITLWTAVPTMACLAGGWGEPSPEVVKEAAVVVVGRVRQYEIVKQLGRGREYARFRIAVDKVLKGQPPNVITATWSLAVNNGFVQPELLHDGPYLIALRGTGPDTVEQYHNQLISSPEAGVPPVLQWLCDSGVFLDATSDAAMAIRRKLLNPAQ